MDRSSRTAEEGLPRWEQGAVVVEMGVVELLLLGITRRGLLQLVPAEEGAFLLFAEVRALLQQPVGDTTLTDTYGGGEGERGKEKVDGREECMER